MKICPNCKAELDENARFCLRCMTSLEEKQEIIVTEKEGTVTTYEVTVNVAPSADIVEEENNTVWLIIIIILILLIVIETIYIVVKKKKEGK